MENRLYVVVLEGGVKGVTDVISVIYEVIGVFDTLEGAEAIAKEYQGYLDDHEKEMYRFRTLGVKYEINKVLEEITRFLQRVM